VIDLLARLEAADRAAHEHPVCSARGRELLGWDRVTRQVACFCHNARAGDAVRAQLPYADSEVIQLFYSLADELRPLAAAGQWPPMSDISSELTLIEQEDHRRLEGQDLVAIARLAEDLDQLRQWFLKGRAALPVWGEAAAQASDFGSLATELRRCLDRDGHLNDNATPVLARLRRAARDREQQVRQSVTRAMAEANRRGWTTGDEVTMRGNRFCLPLQAGDKRKLPGIVHDRSHTGQTIYVEPADTVHLANDLAETRLEMGAEESRILLDLNQRVDLASPALQEAGALLVLADRIKAGMQWSEARRAQRPHLAAGITPRICRGRHPLLEETLAPEPVTPLDLDLPADRRVLVISGPNAGGKSVAMKTVGVLALLAQCGWDVPAREDTRLPLVRRLFVDLGDEQSIEDSLSSFSAHLTHLKRYLDEADHDSLLILDEVGSGTDPQEGTALALTALEHLADRGALVLASTHFGLLKAAVHDHGAMVNAAMDYDEDSLAPLFTLRLGDPGASHAFDIAARVGLDQGLLDRARKLVGEERYQLEQLLQDLARRANELAEKETAANDRLDAVTTRQEELDKRLAGMAKEIKREQAAVRRRGDDLLRQARRELEEAVREIKTSHGEKRIIKKARTELDRVAATLPESAPAAAGAPADLAPGDRVKVPHLGLKGQVTEVRGDKVGILADGLRLNVDRDAIERTSVGGAQATDSEAKIRDQAGAWTWEQDDPGIPPELDLRGQRAEEAWEKVDRLIDRALPVGLDQVTIVHGIGTGRLREFLLAKLKADSRVGEVHPSGERQNNFGASVIHLR